MLQGIKRATVKMKKHCKENVPYSVHKMSVALFYDISWSLLAISEF